MRVKRIFIAIDISDETRKRVAAYIEDLKSNFLELRVGWERPEKLHLTLRFLGDTDENKLEKVCEIVASATNHCESLSVGIGGTGVFPNPRNPRILWIGVQQGGQKMIELNREIESGLEKTGFPSEKRSFHPHLTIGRIRDSQKGRNLAEAHINAAFEPVVFTAPGVTIYESRLQKPRSIYLPIRFFPFS